MKWYVNRNGQILGPVDSHQIDQWIAGGMRDVWVMNDVDGKWVTLDSSPFGRSRRNNMIFGGVIALVGLVVAGSIIGEANDDAKKSQAVNIPVQNKINIVPQTDAANFVEQRYPPPCDLSALWYINSNRNYLGYSNDEPFEKNLVRLSNDIKKWSPECQKQALTKARTEDCDDDFLIKAAINGMSNKLVREVINKTQTDYNTCKRQEAKREQELKRKIAEEEKRDESERKRCSGANIINTCCSKFMNSGTSLSSCLKSFVVSGCSNAADLIIYCNG